MNFAWVRYLVLGLAVQSSLSLVGAPDPEHSPSGMCPLYLILPSHSPMPEPLPDIRLLASATATQSAAASLKTFLTKVLDETKDKDWLSLPIVRVVRQSDAFDACDVDPKTIPGTIFVKIEKAAFPYLRFRVGERTYHLMEVHVMSRLTWMDNTLTFLTYETMDRRPGDGNLLAMVELLEEPSADGSARYKIDLRLTNQKPRATENRLD